MLVSYYCILMDYYRKPLDSYSMVFIQGIRKYDTVHWWYFRYGRYVTPAFYNNLTIFMGAFND
jgi:hypothetical protein